MLHFTDQLNRTIQLTELPRRIISLVPSQTEFLHDLGLENEVIGITKFCVHPEKWFRSKTRIGGTKQYDFDKIESLQTDLIIGNKEENDQEQIEKLMQKYPVWMSDIQNLDDAYTMMLGLGELTGKNEQAKEIVTEIKFRFDSLRRSDFPNRKAAYFIWKNPWMVAGKNTFIDHLMSICNLENVFFDMDSRYPEISLEILQKERPDLILLSSEPYPFKDKHIAELQALLPNADIKTVDGEIFSWYGSRLLLSPAYFTKLFT
jgi:ABC-type Fe3+-hydroxamate transport system substrate-binding protein